MDLITTFFMLLSTFFMSIVIAIWLAISVIIARVFCEDYRYPVLGFAWVASSVFVFPYAVWRLAALLVGAP